MSGRPDAAQGPLNMVNTEVSGHLCASASHALSPSMNRREPRERDEGVLDDKAEDRGPAVRQ